LSSGTDFLCLVVVVKTRQAMRSLLEEMVVGKNTMMISDDVDEDLENRYEPSKGAQI
jgi:hypothetical protein